MLDFPLKLQINKTELIYVEAACNISEDSRETMSPWQRNEYNLSGSYGIICVCHNVMSLGRGIHKCYLGHIDIR
jgi:hypothetical protein